MAKKLLRRPAVEAKTGCSRSSLYELIAEGKFPKPVRISPGRVAWVEEDIDAWIESRSRLTVGYQRFSDIVDGMDAAISTRLGEPHRGLVSETLLIIVKLIAEGKQRKQDAFVTYRIVKPLFESLSDHVKSSSR